MRKTFKRFIVVALMAATLSLTSCDVMLGMLGGMAMGLASSNPYSYSSSYRSNNNYLLDPNYAIWQTQQQQAQMNAVNQQLMQTSVKQAEQQTKELERINQQLIETSIWQAEHGINLGGTESSPSNEGSSKNPVQPHQISEDCTFCHHSGKCNTCNGKHWYYGYTGDKITCPNCKPDGRCTHCGGSGTVTKTRYY